VGGGGGFLGGGWGWGGVQGGGRGSSGLGFEPLDGGWGRKQESESSVERKIGGH